MRVRVDHVADAVHVNLADRPIKESEEVADGIVVDYDDQGRILGVDASKRTDDPGALKTYSFVVPAAGRFRPSATGSDPQGLTPLSRAIHRCRQAPG